MRALFRAGLAVTAVAAASLATAPAASAQVVGSVSTPIVVPRPFDLPAAQLPPLPQPFEWAPSSPRFVASNWVEMYTGCPAAHQWAYTQNGTKVWCSQVARTDGHMWAPTPDPFVPPSATGFHRSTAVANSLGGKECGPVGATAIDQSNGQEAYCDWRRINSAVPLWQYRA